MENRTSSPNNTVMSSTIDEIRNLLSQSRQNVAVQVNQELISTYWKIGEIIVRYEQNEQIRAAYGEKTLLALSKELTKELGKGFTQRKDGRYQTRISLGGGKKPICLYGHTLKEVKKKRENY